MFERFTRAARGVVRSAVAEAERRGDPMLGTEHLLVGLASSYATFGSAFLERFGVTIDSLRTGLADRDATALASVGIDVDLTAVGEEPVGRRRKGHRRFTSAAKEALEGALGEAIAMKHRHIGPEHLLLSLTQDGPDDAATRLLQALDVDPQVLHSATLNALKASRV